MATEIVRWCDVCMTSDERVPAAAHDVQLDRKSGTLDLCPDHAKALLAPLLELLAPLPRQSPEGRKGVGGRRAIEGDAVCPVCSGKFRDDRLAPHMRKQHGLDVDARRALGVS